MPTSSIFNDVIGPVMRGPSSSHSAAACRIGLLLHDLMDGDIGLVEIDYDPNGSLVTTHESQGTDMGLYGGLLGWQASGPYLLVLVLTGLMVLRKVGFDVSNGGPIAILAVWHLCGIGRLRMYRRKEVPALSSTNCSSWVKTLRVD